MIKENFTSFPEFVDKAIRGKSTLREMSRSSRRSGYDEWAGGSWEDCAKLARTGWRKGAEKIEKMAAPLLTSITSHMRRQEIVFDVQGDSIDIGTFMTGFPEPFIRWDETELEAKTYGKFVHVVCNVAASSYFTTEQLFSKGAAVCTVVDALEMTGHRVSVDVVSMVSPSSNYGYDYGNRRGSDDKYMLTVRVKEPEDSLNLESIAFACAHSGMLRRLIFSMEEQQPQAIIDRYGFSESGGYGVPEDPQKKLDCDIYIGASNSDIINDPLAWAQRQLVAQGVEFTS